MTSELRLQMADNTICCSVAVQALHFYETGTLKTYFQFLKAKQCCSEIGVMKDNGGLVRSLDHALNPDLMKSKDRIVEHIVEIVSTSGRFALQSAAILPSLRHLCLTCYRLCKMCHYLFKMCHHLCKMCHHLCKMCHHLCKMCHHLCKVRYDNVTDRLEIDPRNISLCPLSWTSPCLNLFFSTRFIIFCINYV